MKKAILNVASLYVALVLVSAIVFTVLEGLPFMSALYAAIVANVFKTGVCKLHHWYFSEVQKGGFIVVHADNKKRETAA